MTPPKTNTDDSVGKIGRLKSVRTRKAKSVPASKNEGRRHAQSFTSVGMKLDQASEYLDYIEPTRQISDLVLSSAISKSLYDVVEEYKYGDEIRSHRLPLRNRLLFCGPPGCGKSITAEVLAREVGLPLVVAKLDTLIGSLLGETASNLKKVFDSIERQNVVLFFDEFDALARTRTDPAEHNEMRRVVNNLLLMIEKYKGRGLIIAATNLEASIDAAILRRFDEVVFFGNPTAAQAHRLMNLKLKNFPKELDLREFSKGLSGRSHSDIERICFTAMRRAILARRKSVTEADFRYALDADKRRFKIKRQITLHSEQ